MRTQGRVERMAAPDIWNDRARNFNPWLVGLPHPRLLGEMPGIDLELEAVGQGVRPYLAAILR